MEVTENEEVIKQEPILSEEDANLSARRRTHQSSTRRRRHRERDRDRVSSEDGGDGGDCDGGASNNTPIDNLDFVGELNGSSSASEMTTDDNNNNNNNNNSIAANSGVSFGENHVRTFETDSSERINEYMSHDADGDDDGDGDDGRLKIGGDIKLDTLDIHTLNDTQNINAPPLLDDIEVLA